MTEADDRGVTVRNVDRRERVPTRGRQRMTHPASFGGSMSTISSVRHAIARLDLDNPGHASGRPEDSTDRKVALDNNVTSAALATVNAVVSGTPIALITGPVTMFY